WLPRSRLGPASDLSVAATHPRGSSHRGGRAADHLSRIRAPSRTASGEPLRVFDPAAAHRLVQIGVRLEELRLRGYVGELSVEQRLLGSGDLEIDGRAFAIAQIGQVAKTLQGFYLICLLLAHLPEFRAIDERVLHVLEGADDRLLVGIES